MFVGQATERLQGEGEVAVPAVAVTSACYSSAALSSALFARSLSSFGSNATQFSTD